MTGRAEGVVGVCVRARDPDAVSAWYAGRLGVPSVDFWSQPAGRAVFAPFQADTDYWPADRQFMFTFRVTGLSSIIDRLRSAGIAVETRPDEWDSPTIGRFARIVDPEGNSIELWEPAEVWVRACKHGWAA